MAHTCGMTRTDPPLRIRLSADLKAAVQARAALNRRSMNAEINACLERRIQDDGNSPLLDVTANSRINILSELVETLRKEIATLSAKFDQRGVATGTEGDTREVIVAGESPKSKFLR